MTSILLLSGGASRRMGQDKARLPIADVDLLTWQEQRFQQAGYPVVSRIKDRFSGYQGPLAGIHAACVSHPGVHQWLILPVDMPRISVSAVKNLIAEGERTARPACYQDCPLPLYLPVTNELIPLLEHWLEDPSGPRSVYALVRHLNGHWVGDTGLKHELMNVNTPEQWRGFMTGAETV